MALNPVPLVRDVSNDPTHQRGVHAITGRIAGGGTHVVTIETRLKSIIYASVCKEDATTAVVAVAIGSSSVYPGTETVAFTVASGGEYSYLVVGLLDTTATLPSTGGATTITYNPITGDVSVA